MSFDFRPGARIDIDGRSLTAAEAGLETMRLTLGIATHGQAGLVVWPGSKFAGVRPGASISVALGQDETLVMRGAVSTVTELPERLLIMALDATAPLSQTRRSLTFRDMNAADMVSALAAEAGVDTETLDAGTTFPAYAIDNRLSLWRHLCELAALTGADLTSTPEGKLRFAVGSGAQARQLRKGAQIMDWGKARSMPVSSHVFGTHGAASSAGAQAWHQIDPDPLGEEPETALVPGVARSREIADAGARAAALRAARRASRARAVIFGDAAIRPAGSVEILDEDSAGLLAQAAGVPGVGSGGASYRVLTIRHELSPTTGFVTTLDLEGEVEDASALGALTGGLGL